MKVLSHFALAAVLAAACIGTAQNVQASSNASAPPSVAPKAKTLFDTDLMVPADGTRWVPLTLTAPTRVRISVRGVEHTAKGYTVKLIDPASAVHVVRGEATQGHPDFYSTGLSMKRTAVLDAGEYTLLISNSENTLNEMVVHLEMTLNPKDDE